MNFSLQLIPLEEKLNQNTISMTLDDTNSHDQPDQALAKITHKKKSSKLDKKEKVSWNLTECKRYLKFLVQNQHLLELQKKDKRRLKLNVKMSKVIKSRDGAQCHSHHQKMMLKYGSVSQIIASLKYLSQEKMPKTKELSEQHQKIVSVNEFELQEFALNFDFKQSSPFYGEQLIEIDLMQPECYQYNLGNSWDDCFI